MTLETQTNFALRLKRNRSTISRWAATGRIVMRGKKVDVEASIVQLAATPGPRPDVAERNGQSGSRRVASDDESHADLAATRRARAAAELRVKTADAAIREMERDKLSGKLIDKAVVDFVLDDLGASVRAAMENFAGLVAPNVFGLATLQEIYGALDAAAQCVLEELSATMKRHAHEAEKKK